MLVLFASLQLLGVGFVADLLVRSAKSHAEVPPAAMREWHGAPGDLVPEEAGESAAARSVTVRPEGIAAARQTG